MINGIPTRKYQLSIGGVWFNDAENVICLYGATDAGAKFTAMRRVDNAIPTAGYTPSGAKKFLALAARVSHMSSGMNARLRSGDNDIGSNAGAGMTNAKEIGNLLNSNITLSSGNFSTGEGPQNELPLKILFPNAKYIELSGNGGGCNMFLYGYEVD